jgi:hypothetical protein
MPSALVTLDAVAYRSPNGRTLFDNLTLALGREKTGLIAKPWSRRRGRALAT